MTGEKILWQLPPAPVPFLGEEPQIWLASLDRDPACLGQLTKILSPDERERAQRYHAEQDRRRFIARRAILRILLGRYLSTEPSKLQFQYGDMGKPFLAEPHSSRTVHFNVSYSQGWALLAFVRNYGVGVDLERIRPIPEAKQIVDDFASPYERTVWHSLPEELKLQGFFNWWTRKEAFLKAGGKGVTCGLQEFDVSIAPGVPTRLLRSPAAALPVERWALREVLPVSGYAAAFVVAGPTSDARCWSWADSPKTRNPESISQKPVTLSVSQTGDKPRRPPCPD